MRRAEKDILIRSKIADIMKLKYRRDLLVDQREPKYKIEAIESQIEVLRQELEDLRNMPEDTTENIPTTITVQGGSVGQINIDTHGNVSQHNNYETNVLPNIDLSTIAKELSKLQQAMSSLSQSTAHNLSIHEIEKAKQAAQQGNEQQLYRHLRAAGQWALEVATKIGVSIAVDALRIALGLK